MDIEYLLFLQNIRETYVPFLVPFMESVSLFAISYILFIPALIYWVKDKEEGRYILTVWSVTNALNALVKLTVCCYRPWIRDPRVIPAGDAITTATGYSFPSGHSVWSSTLYGSTAYCCYKRKKTVLAALLICAALLTAFSRNFLGVHTPQDVIVGMSEGFIMTFLIAKAYRYTDEHPEKLNRFLIAGAVLAAAGIVYIMVKPYPMTYVNGVLLVDPVRMRYDGVQDISAMIMVMAAVYVDKKWIQYKPVELKGAPVLVLIAGSAGLYWVITYLRAICIQYAGPEPGRVLFSFLMVFYIMVAVPFALKLSAAKTAGQSGEAGTAQ